LRPDREPLANAVIAGKVIFAAPAVESEALGTSLRPTAGNNRTSIAQPDIAEGLDDNLGKGRQPAGLIGGGFICRDQPDFLARAIGMDRGRERGDFNLCGSKIIFPKVGSAWKTDPNGLVGCPFRKWKLTHGAGG